MEYGSPLLPPSDDFFRLRARASTAPRPRTFFHPHREESPPRPTPLSAEERARLPSNAATYHKLEPAAIKVEVKEDAEEKVEEEEEEKIVKEAGEAV